MAESRRCWFGVIDVSCLCTIAGKRERLFAVEVEVEVVFVFVFVNVMKMQLGESNEIAARRELTSRL